MRLLKWIGLLIWVLVLTVLSQLGGLVFLLCLPLFKWLGGKVKIKSIYQWGINLLTFLLVYGLVITTLVPPLAKAFGRVPLPVYNQDSIKPLNIMTCILNRHYVRADLYQSIVRVSQGMNEEYPGTILTYLDANFPFLDGFPLLPHLSHNDGKKIDFAFFYQNDADEALNHYSPSWIGYGVYESPRLGEVNQPEICEKKGAFQYGILKYLNRSKAGSDSHLDEIKTKKMIKLFCEEPSVSKLFIEPHLKQRMGLHHRKVRYHGCRAVRHDDHLHIQIK